MKRHANALTRKLGPLPVWAWALVSGGVLYVVRNRGTLTGAGGTSASPQGGTTGMPGPAGPQGRPGKPGKPARKPKGKKPPRRKKPPKKHRKPKHPKGAPPGVQGPTSQRRRVVVPNLARHRNRTTVTTGTGSHGLPALSRDRGTQPHAGLALSAAAAMPGNAHDGQRSEPRFPIEQGRAHTGGVDRTPQARARTAEPTAEGRTNRTRVLGGTQPHAIDRGNAVETPAATQRRQTPSRTPQRPQATRTRLR